MAGKPHINLVFIGHIDHGKSTLIGRMLVEIGSIDQRIIDKFAEEAKEYGKETFKFAWVIDKLKEERKRGVTIDIAWNKMETQHRNITIIDAPGHRDFLKNMITGANEADAAVLVVDAMEGVMEQTREHIYLSRTLGVHQLIVAVNKMDRVDYSNEKYKEVVGGIKKLCKLVGYDIDKIIFVPTSAYFGDNIIKKSDKTPWYAGKTLVQAIDSLEEPEKPLDKPLRVPIDKVYGIKGVGTVLIGRVETGILKINDKVVFNPSGSAGEVKSIEMHHEQMEKAVPGDNIGFNVRGVDKTSVKKGDVCGHVNSPPNIITVKDSFDARIVVLEHPSSIGAGHVPTLFCHTESVPVKITVLKSKIDPSTGQEVVKNPPNLKTGESGIVTIQPLKPLVIEKASDIPELSRFAMREGGFTVAAGIRIN